MRPRTWLRSKGLLIITWNLLLRIALAQAQSPPQPRPNRSPIDATARANSDQNVPAPESSVASSTLGKEKPRLSLKRRDWLLIGGAGAVTAAALFQHPAHSCPLNCYASQINALDQFATRHDSSAADHASTVLLWGVLPSTIALTSVSDRHSPSVISDLAVVGETVLVNSALLQVVKNTVGRPRPLAYRKPTTPEQEIVQKNLLEKDDTYQSFYSGHTSTAFAMGLSYAQLYLNRHQNRHERLVKAGFLALGATIGALRIGAGKHFPTDVMVGTAMGSTFSMTIPHLHK